MVARAPVEPPLAPAAPAVRRCVSESDRGAFDDFIASAFARGADRPSSCELTLSLGGPLPPLASPSGGHVSPIAKSSRSHCQGPTD